ncbi:T-cell surface glycoprotein CD4 isoform X1 [Fukomys damarensis]|uniref:T-cell surface glycoprotein CD4 isoform X1 n=2 Tax=Fukomys damarensis TaxID=885580 RepID=UPI00053F48BA|nr:T-cell surface glycoprotein CD4 isoform X1 [Fukomys damarensis]
MKAELFSRLLLLLLPVVVTQGKEVRLGKEGGTVELPCTVSEKQKMDFSWKFPNETKILGKQRTYLTRGKTHLSDRIDSRSSQWDQGSFPLIIRKLEVRDSGTYICDVATKKMVVDLLVFRLSPSSGTRLLQGQTLTLALEGPEGSSPSVQFTGPSGQVTSGKKAISVPMVGLQHSGTWKCTVSQAQKQLQWDIHVMVLDFLKSSSTAYRKEGEALELSFPLTFEDEALVGELSWRADRALSSQVWVSFSVENRKVTVQAAAQDPKLQVAEKTPLCLTLSKALLQHAGSGNLTLTLAGGLKLCQEVHLVVMRVSQLQNSLVCEVQGPTSPTMELSWERSNQKSQVQAVEKKQVQVSAPEAGTWRCFLRDRNKVLLESEVDVVSRGLHQDHSTFLAIVVGSTAGCVLLTVLCIFCCVRCRHQRRRAEQMSQIKRLLSEKKTCQCSHQLQKARNVT